ncbi:MAG TPA: hypothetical protein VMY79_01480 [Dehalococcoidia bacterium]|nr:hypothetical protein [Dehalococcoidia bacterium]
MSIFNRLVVVVIALAILAGAVITFLVAAEVVTPDILPYAWLEPQLQSVSDATDGRAGNIIAITVVVALGMIVILLSEFIPLNKPATLLINSTDKGISTIDVDSVCILAEHTGATIRDVRDVKSSVRESAEGLLISCRTSVALGSNLLELEAETRTRISETVEQLTGLPVAQVDIKIKYESKKAKQLSVR